MTLGMAFTVQVLRFDQDADWGLGIGAAVMGRMPINGTPLVHLKLGGPIIAGETLSRFFAIHSEKTLCSRGEHRALSGLENSSTNSHATLQSGLLRYPGVATLWLIEPETTEVQGLAIFRSPAGKPGDRGCRG
jgi:hypothetical protein